MTTGRCLCGAIRYEYEGEASSGHALPLRELPPPDIIAADDVHHRAQDGIAIHPGAGQRSSPRRRAWQQLLRRVRLADLLPGRGSTPRIDLYACTLDDPSSLAPQCHVHAVEQLPWFEVADDLPRYPGSNRGGQPLRHGPRR